jgi:hypothetical protein
MNMKRFFVVFFFGFNGFLYGQDKYNYVRFDKLTEVEGSEYVIAARNFSGIVKCCGNTFAHNG